MKILIYGINGKMGKILYDAVKEENTDTVICGVDKFGDGKYFDCPVYTDCSAIHEKPDCIIDFAIKDAIYDYLPYAVKNSVPCVIAATGHDEKDLIYIKKAAESIPIFKSGNMSLGINLLIKLAEIASSVLGDKADIEIIEQHHRRKVDAPSGTALMIADAIKKIIPDETFVIGRNENSDKRQCGDLGISSVRGGTVAGKHEILFLMDGEVVSIQHEAEDRTIFANGSITAARFIVAKEKGLYNSKDLFD